MGSKDNPRFCMPVYYDVDPESATMGFYVDEDEDEQFPVIYLYYNEKESPVIAHILRQMEDHGLEPEIHVWQTDKEDAVMIRLVLPNPDLVRLKSMGVSCTGSLEVVADYLKRSSKIPKLVIIHRLNLPWGSMRKFIRSFEEHGITVLSVSDTKNVPIANCVATTLNQSCPYEGAE